MEVFITGVAAFVPTVAWVMRDVEVSTSLSGGMSSELQLSSEDFCIAEKPQIHTNETGHYVAFSVVDRDDLSGNDFFASISFSAAKLVDAVPVPKPRLWPLRSTRNQNTDPGIDRAAPEPSLLAATSTADPIGIAAPTSSPYNGGNGLSSREDINTKDSELETYVLSLDLKNDERWSAKHLPVLRIRAKFVPHCRESSV